MSRPSRRVAVARLRRLARYLDRLPEGEYEQIDCTRCVIGHGRRLFHLARSVRVADYLGIPEESVPPIFGGLARINTPAGKAQQLRALAARLAQEGDRPRSVCW